MNKKAILAIAAIVVIGIMLSATGAMAKEVRMDPEPQEEDASVVAEALAAKIEGETGACIPAGNLDDLLNSAAKAKGECITLADVDGLSVVNHAEASVSAWGVDWVGPVKQWELHYFAPHPQWQTCAAIMWDNSANDLDVFILTAGGFGMSVNVNSLTEEIDPIPTYAPFPFFINWGTLAAVNHWNGPSNQLYVIAVDGC